MWLTAAALCAGCVSAVNALTGVNVYGMCLMLPVFGSRLCTGRPAPTRAPVQMPCITSYRSQILGM